MAGIQLHWLLSFPVLLEWLRHVKNNLVQSYKFIKIVLTLNKKIPGSSHKRASADPANLDWGDLEITPSNGFTWANLTATGFTFNLTADSVNAGDYISVVDGTGRISIRHIDTNTLLGNWDFN